MGIVVETIFLGEFVNDCVFVADKVVMHALDGVHDVGDEGANGVEHWWNVLADVVVVGIVDLRFMMLAEPY